MRHPVLVSHRAVDPIDQGDGAWDDSTTETQPVPRPVFERWMSALRAAVLIAGAIIAASVWGALWLLR